MEEITKLLPDDIQAAAHRLAGHLVATPVIGGLRLTGFDVPPDLRVKPELLQPGGTLRFRGTLHYLLRKLGSLKGLVFWGEVRHVLASALAGQTQRLPMASFWKRDPGASWREQLVACGCAVQVQQEDPAVLARSYAEERGFHVLPPDSADPVDVYKRAALFDGCVDAMNATDGSGANCHMSSVGMCSLLTRRGYAMVMQVSCRDRNRIAIQGDVLGASAMGVSLVAPGARTSGCRIRALGDV